MNLMRMAFGWPDTHRSLSASSFPWPCLPEQSRFLGNGHGYFRKLRLKSRFDHFTVPADEYEAIVPGDDVEGTVVQQPVVRAAQQHEVLQPRLAAVDPVLDMMRFDVALMGTAGEAAAAVVAQLQGAQQRRRHDATPAFVVQHLALRILDELREVGVAGDLAGVLFVDAPVRLAERAPPSAARSASSLRSMVSTTS